jgi:putative surface cell wall-binding protein
MRRSLRMLAVLTFLTGGLTPAFIALTPDVASATGCGAAIAAGSSCTLTGTLGVNAGSLTLTSPTSLTWGETLNGLNQNVVDATAADQQYTVNDATGSGAGWNVSMSATTFTTGSHTLANAGTLSTNGSLTSISGTTAPTATCSAACTAPTDTTTYPVAITTAATSPTPSIIYDTAVATGLGLFVIGGSAALNPVGWWLQIPASVYAGSYTSTVTLEVTSGP